MDHDIRVKTYSPARSTGEARRRAALMLVGATGISSVFVAIIFLAVLKGEWMTGLFAAVAHFMFGKPVWAIVAATSPLVAALLVGYGYMQRAIRRRGTAREAALSASQGLRSRS